MKHLIKNNEIVQSGIPTNFTRENGEGFWGGYQNRTDIHFEDGWREEVIPPFNPQTQQLTGLFYDPVNDVCTFQVEDLEIDLAAEIQRHLDDLSRLRVEIAMIVLQIQLSNDRPPELLTVLTPSIREMYLFGKAEILALTVSNVKAYVLRGAQVQQLMDTLNSMV